MKCGEPASRGAISIKRTHLYEKKNVNYLIGSLTIDYVLKQYFVLFGLNIIQVNFPYFYLKNYVCGSHHILSDRAYVESSEN